MATYYARKAGNVNANDVWATTPGGTAGAQTFVAGDVLVANSFTITLNVDTNLGTGTVTNDNRDGATQGGNFTLSNGVTLTANVFAGGAASTNCVSYSGNATAAVTGNVTGGSAASANGVLHSGTGTLTITGSVTGGTIMSGSASGAHGAQNGGAGTLIVVGNVAANVAAGLYISGSGPTTVTGNCTGGSGASASHGLRNNGSSAVTITGTCSGGTNAAAHGTSNDSNGTINVIGTAVGATGFGATNGSTGTMTVTRAKGGPLASSAVGVNGSATGSTSVSEIEYGDLGASPTSGAIRLTDLSSNVAVIYRFGTTKKTLVDANASGLMPAPSNVRSGIVYNGGNSTGTCAVPAASSVLFGVPVDDTTGTAALTPAAVWDYLTSAATTSNSIGERLRNAATVTSVGQSIADATLATLIFFIQSQGL